MGVIGRAQTVGGGTGGGRLSLAAGLRWYNEGTTGMGALRQAERRLRQKYYG
jgi:hypothetical protein